MPQQSSSRIESAAPGSGPEGLDWNLLRTFLAIVEEGSITGAALRLGLKQPSVSNALRRLEDSLGHRLIERGPRSFSVTRHGEALRRECIDIVGAIDRLPGLLGDLADEVRGKVSIALASHVVCPLFDDSLAGFHRRHPRATVEIAVAASRDAVASVAARRSSLAICLVRERRDGLDHELLYREHFGFFCGPGHRLHGKTGLDLADLAGEHCVSFHTDHPDDVLHPVALLRARAGLDRRPSGVSSNLEEVRRMIVAGLGIGALPIHVVADDLAQGRLWRLPPYRDPPAIDIFLVTNPASRPNRAEAAFLGLFQSRIAATPLAARTYGLDA